MPLKERQRILTSGQNSHYSSVSSESLEESIPYRSSTSAKPYPGQYATVTGGGILKNFHVGGKTRAAELGRGNAMGGNASVGGMVCMGG